MPKTPKTLMARKINKQVLLLGALFLIGVYFHYIRFLPQLDQSIFGDEGDGLFNLWLLEHVRLFFSDFDFERLISTNSFFPENRLALFWSDNLIVPGILYSFIFFWCTNTILSYNLVTFLAIGLAFVTHFFLFRHVAGLALRSSTHKLSLWESRATFFITAFVTYTYTFSATRLLYTVHFQNQWSFLILLALIGMLRVLAGFTISGGILIAIGFVSACYTAMYHAVGLATLLLFFALVFFGTFRGPQLFGSLKKIFPLAILSMLAAAPVLLGYFQTKSDLDEAIFRGPKFSHFIAPHPESLSEDVFQKLGIHFVTENHESLVYLGFFLLICAIPPLWFYVRLGIQFVYHRTYLRYPLFVLLLAFAGVRMVSSKYDSRELVLLATVVFILLFVMFLFSVIAAIRQGVLESRLALLFLAAVVLYGIAFGVTSAFERYSFDSSLFGFLSLVVPGYHSLRAGGRFGVLASGMVFAMILYFSISRVLLFKLQGAPASQVHQKEVRRFPLKFLVIVLLLVCSYWEQIKYPYVNGYNFAQFLRPSQDAVDFFSSFKEPLIAFPTTPWHQNTFAQLFFIRFKGVQMVNGYSGRNSRLFEEFVSEASRIPSPDAAARLRANGVYHIVFLKWRYSPQELERIKEQFSTIVFDDPHVLLVSIHS